MLESDTSTEDRNENQGAKSESRRWNLMNGHEKSPRIAPSIMNSNNNNLVWIWGGPTTSK